MSWFMAGTLLAATLTAYFLDIESPWFYGGVLVFTLAFSAYLLGYYVGLQTGRRRERNENLLLPY